MEEDLLSVEKHPAAFQPGSNPGSLHLTPEVPAAVAGDASGADTSKPVGFAGLLEMVATVSPLLRVRFATSHPKDLSDDVLQVMAKT